MYYILKGAKAMPGKSKMIRYMKNYIYSVHVKNKNGFFNGINARYWNWRIERMTEGEIMNAYYALTNKGVQL